MLSLSVLSYIWCFQALQIVHEAYPLVINFSAIFQQRWIESGCIYLDQTSGTWMASAWLSKLP